MKLTLGSKIFFGAGILVAGYVTSVTVGFVMGTNQERAMGAVADVSVPAALKSQTALFLFDDSAKAFMDGSRLSS